MRRRSAGTGRPRGFTLWERGARKGARRGAIAAVAALIVGVIAACGTSNSPACYAGDFLYCTCLGGATGTQACSSNGSYGPCACTDSGTGPHAEAGGDGATNLPYMATCFVVGMPGDCAPTGGDECFDFPNRGMYCTRPCTANTDCPLPSTGCNGMGVCKAAGATPPGDGGAEAD